MNQFPLLTITLESKIIELDAYGDKVFKITNYSLDSYNGIERLRLSGRTYSTVNENGGFETQIIISGSSEDIFYNLATILTTKRRKYIGEKSSINIVSRNVNNKVSLTNQYK